MKYLIWPLVLVIFGAVFISGFLLYFGNSETLEFQSEAAENIDAHPDIKILSLQIKNQDIEFQKPLENPPKIIKALYATSWSASSAKKLNYLIDLIKKTELNAIVIDIKDYSGNVTYQTEIEKVNEYKATEKRILRPNEMIKRLHDEGIYVIARQAVFQDQQFAKARPDLALQNKITGKSWKDRKGLMWMDSASKEVWDYNIAIAKDALNRGFDEINFDYIRFASDGDVGAIKYPIYDETIPKQEIMRQFFEYLRNQLVDAKISADIFGMVLIMKDGQGIGQYFENVLPYFDAVAPMVYPSHYASGFSGFKNPANYPYEVVKYSLEIAASRMAAMNTATSTAGIKLARIRPWLQDFDLGAVYDAQKVRGQIQAVYDVLNENNYDGFMLWDPANNYTPQALLAE